MAAISQYTETELLNTVVSKPTGLHMGRCNRWNKSKGGDASLAETENLNAGAPQCLFQDTSSDESTCPSPPTPHSSERRPRTSKHPSYILQHYHSTGCSGGAFSFRAAALDPSKSLVLCTEPREYRQTTLEDILISKEDKSRGGGPRVGPFQEVIPGSFWSALPKYDFTTRNRSSAFNERMHVEWENHVDHILKNGGELPTASVVAKAGFRSCAPCCRDMLALARPTGKTFIMVDLAEDDSRGTFHFVTGDKYLPVPKESCTAIELDSLKKIVADAQAGVFDSSSAIYNAVIGLNVPIDQTAQALYLGDRALLPSGCGASLKGAKLLDVLHAEHFARLCAEYGASIMRDDDRPLAQQQAVGQCRRMAKEMLINAWSKHIPEQAGLDLESYALAATAPLLPESSAIYLKMRRSGTVPRSLSSVDLVVAKEGGEHDDKRRWGVGGLRKQKLRLTSAKLQAIEERMNMDAIKLLAQKSLPDDDATSTMAPSTAFPDDGLCSETDEEDFHPGDTGVDLES